MLSLILAAAVVVLDPSEPFVLVKVTKVGASYSPGVIKGHKGQPQRLLNIHAEGIVPRSGYLAEMLMPRQSGLAKDGYLEYDFQAIPNVENGVDFPTVIVADGAFSFDVGTMKVKGVRVFGAKGSKVEKTVPDIETPPLPPEVRRAGKDIPPSLMTSPNRPPGWGQPINAQPNYIYEKNYNGNVRRP